MGVAGNREGDLAGLGATPLAAIRAAATFSHRRSPLAGEPFSFAGGSKGKSVMAKPPRLPYESVNFSPRKEIMMAPSLNRHPALRAEVRPTFFAREASTGSARFDAENPL
jgi:hypothetical protein